MKPISYVLVMLIMTCAHGSAQSGATGTWRAEGVGAGAWTVVLKADGRKLTGRVSGCTSLPVEIYDGRVDGKTISFKCRSTDDDRIVTLTGTIDGDEMRFTWEKEVREGGALLPNPVDLNREDPNAREMFGASTPQQFTGKRVTGGVIEVAAAVNLKDKGVKVEGTLLLPPTVTRVRAVIVLVNSGTSWDGMGGAFYRDQELRRLAATLECAVLLPRITPIVQDGSQPNVLGNAAVGFADGLLQLLDRVAQESGHREVAAAPLLFWAHSRTVQLTTTFAALHSQRTIGFVSYHGGTVAAWAGHNESVLKNIPALILLEKVGVDRNATLTNWPFSVLPPVETLFRNARQIGAPWTFAIEPDAVHQNPDDLKAANALVIPWMSAVLRQRLPPDGRGLRVVSEASGWLGDPRTGRIAPVAEFSGAREEASWLPDEQSARGWQIVVGAAR